MRRLFITLVVALAVLAGCDSKEPGSESSGTPDAKTAGSGELLLYCGAGIRPPAEDGVGPPDEAATNRAYQILREKIGRVETLIGYEGNAFAHTGNVEDDLLSITAVHPMREDAVAALLARDQADWSAVHALTAAGQLVETTYGGHRFYLRKTHSGQGHQG